MVNLSNMRMINGFLLVLVVIVTTIALGEGVTRLAGFKPYNTGEIKFDYKPALPAEIDSIYAYSLVPGYFTLIKNDTFVYHATHNGHRRRITSYDTADNAHQNKVIILGCSFTYGDGLEDSCTHPFILQGLFRQNNINLNVENWGVGGYCPAQFFLQAREIIHDTSVKYVVINYSQVQDERVICSRSWRKSHVKFTNQLKYQKLIYHPYFTWNNGSVQLKYKTMSYTFLPFQEHLALVELVDNACCNYENKSAATITQTALKQTIDILQNAGIKVILTSITGDDKSNEVISRFNKQGYRTLLFGFSTGEKGYNLLPTDGHPNHYANKIFADKLYKEIKSMR